MDIPLRPPDVPGALQSFRVLSEARQAGAGGRVMPDEPWKYVVGVVVWIIALVTWAWVL